MSDDTTPDVPARSDEIADDVAEEVAGDVSATPEPSAEPVPAPTPAEFVPATPTACPIGPPVTAGTTVVLGVSKGAYPDTSGFVTVPEVTGLSEANAIEAMQHAGLNVAVVSDPGPVRTGRVWAQTPPAGTGASSGAKAAIIVSSGKPEDGSARTVLPDLVGRPQAEAEDVLRSVGLSTFVVADFNSAVPAGYVVTQQPNARSLAAEPDDRVWMWVVGALGVIMLALIAMFIFVSPATEQVTVPSIVGLTSAEAESVIASAGLKVGSITTVVTTATPEGLVASQEPTAGASADADSAVNFVVATASQTGTAPGTPPTSTPAPGGGTQPAANVVVPNVVGQTKDVATRTLQDAGLASSAYENYSATVPTGQVIAQSPPSGSSVAKGTTIALSVSKGQSPPTITNVAVPSVVNLPQADAEKALTDVGLVAVAAKAASQSPTGTVFAQVPVAGDSVATGTSVLIAVSAGPPPTGQ